MKTDEKDYIQVDGFIVVPHKPRRGDEDEPPASWREVGIRIHQLLKAIAVQPFVLIHEALRSTTQTIRGLGDLPGAVAKKVQTAHNSADRREGEKQAALEAGNLRALPLPAEEELRRLEGILMKVKVKGHEAFVTEKEGIPIIVVVNPEAAEELPQLIESAVAGLLTSGRSSE